MKRPQHFRRGFGQIAAGFQLWRSPFRKKGIFPLDERNPHTLVIRIGSHWFEIYL